MIHLDNDLAIQCSMDLGGKVAKEFENIRGCLEKEHERLIQQLALSAGSGLMKPARVAPLVRGRKQLRRPWNWKGGLH